MSENNTDSKFDFSEEEKTNPDSSTSDELMEQIGVLRSPGIPTSTSERPTRPIRALIATSIRWREEA